MFRLLPHYHRSHQETVVPSQSQDSLSPLESSSYHGDLEEHKVLQTQPFGDGVVAGFISLEEEASLGVLNHFSGELYTLCFHEVAADRLMLCGPSLWPGEGWGRCREGCLGRGNNRKLGTYWVHLDQRQGPGRHESPTAGWSVVEAFSLPAILEPGFRRVLPP